MTDPASIPKRVLFIAERSVWDETGDVYFGPSLAVAIAAALDALFTDEPLAVPPDDVVVSPRRVLAAVLAPKPVLGPAPPDGRRAAL